MGADTAPANTRPARDILNVSPVLLTHTPGDSHACAHHLRTSDALTQSVGCKPCKVISLHPTTQQAQEEAAAWLQAVRCSCQN